MAGIIDDLFGSPEEDAKAQEYLKQMQEAYGGVIPPEPGDVNFEQYSYGGDYQPSAYVQAPNLTNPEAVAAQRAEAAQMGDSAMQGIAVDPRLKGAQLAALSSLQEIGNNGGMTAADTANLSRIQTDNSTADRGRRDAILQNMSARGMGGSGNELLAQLQSSQAATDRGAQQGLDVAGMAQQRALQALQQGGSMAGSMRGQEFGEQSDVAKASDSINQFNAANRQQSGQFNAAQGNSMNQFNAGAKQQNAQFNAGNSMQAQQFNAGAQNAAGQAGWQARQGIANQNVDTQNKQKLINQVELGQQKFQNQATLAGGKANAAAAGSNYWGVKGNQTAQMKGNLYGAGAQLGSAAIMYSDESEKKNISQLSEADIMDFLTAVKPKKFKYKDESKPGTLPGDRIGFIAQDVADTKAGKSLISQDDEGKMQYDPENLQGIMLAALSSIAKKGAN